jgi:hypothetical protein
MQKFLVWVYVIPLAIGMIYVYFKAREVFGLNDHLGKQTRDAELPMRRTETGLSVPEDGASETDEASWVPSITCPRCGCVCSSCYTELTLHPELAGKPAGSQPASGR